MRLGKHIFYFNLSFTLTLCMLGNFSCFCCRQCCLFSKLTFSKNSFSNTIRVSNSFDSDQDRSSVGPEQVPKCLQRLSADNKKSPLARKELKLLSYNPENGPIEHTYGQAFAYLVYIERHGETKSCSDIVQLQLKCGLKFGCLQVL